MFSHFPKQLPLFCALIAGIVPVAYFFSGMFFELIFGRPSSTAAIGFVFVPIYGVITGGFGLLIGLVIRFIWRGVSTIDLPTSKVKKGSSVILIFSFLTSVILGISSTYKYIKGTEPAILHDGGVFKYTIVPVSLRAVKSATKMFDAFESVETVKWGENETQIIKSKSEYLVKDNLNGKTCSLPYSGLDYVTAVYGVPMAISEGDHQVLAMVIAGRATGGRAILALMSNDYELLYVERFERFWSLDVNPLGIIKGQDPNLEMGIVGPESNDKRVFFASKAS
jgi:hypothetical protein